MKFGVSMFLAEGAVGPGPLAQAVEAAGLDSLWFPDHTHTPVGGSSKWPWDPSREVASYYAEIPDLFVALTAAAVSTTRIRVGSAICVLPQRDPIVAAKQAATIDRLSGGRLTLGVGPGWDATEMANHGIDFDRRYEVMDEKIAAAKAIWSSDVAEFHGEHCDFGPIRCGPEPAQVGGPPVLVSGESKRARELAIGSADGWLPRGRELAKRGIVDEIRKFRELCANADRAQRVVVLDTAHEARDVDAYALAEVDEVVFRLPPTSPDDLPGLLGDVVALAAVAS
jgi:probable F420-dependent oxidoreductase